MSNILGGIAIQTVVLVALDAFGVRERRPLTYQGASLTLVIEGAVVVAVLVAVIMGTQLPATLIRFRLTPDVLLITLIWVVGLILTQRAGNHLPWSDSGEAPDSQPEPRGHSQRKRAQQATQKKISTARVATVFAIAAVATLVAGALAEESGTAAADHIGLSGVLFGATVLAAATSLPELSTGLTSTRQGDYKLAFGDIFGGNAFLPVLFLLAVLVSGKPVLPNAHASDIYLTGLGALLTVVYMGGLLFRPAKEHARLGIDSITVLVLYIVGGPLLDNAYTGNRKIEGASSGGTARQLADALANRPLEAAPLIPGAAGLIRTVTADPHRRPFTPREYIAAHLDLANTGAGPVGHGFPEGSDISGIAYYTFPIGDRITGITMDSTNRVGFIDGSLDDAQFRWLERTLIANSSRYFDSTGAPTHHSAPDTYFLLFSHHTSSTMGNLVPNPGHLREPRHSGPELVALLQRFPNVPAWRRCTASSPSTTFTSTRHSTARPRTTTPSYCCPTRSRAVSQSLGSLFRRRLRPLRSAQTGGNRTAAGRRRQAVPRRSHRQVPLRRAQRRDRPDKPVDATDWNPSWGWASSATFSFEAIGENANGLASAIFALGGDGTASNVRLDYYDRSGLGTFTRS